MTGSEPVVLAPGGGRSFSIGADQMQVLTEVDDGTTTFAMVHCVAVPGVSGAPPHVHGNGLHEVWYIIDGELEFLVGEDKVVGGPGTFVHVPPDVVHAYANRSLAETRFVALFAPAWGLRMFEEAAEAAHPADGGPPDRERLVEILRHYGTEIVKVPRR